MRADRRARPSRPAVHRRHARRGRDDRELARLLGRAAPLARGPAEGYRSEMPARGRPRRPAQPRGTGRAAGTSARRRCPGATTRGPAPSTSTGSPARTASRSAPAACPPRAPRRPCPSRLSAPPFGITETFALDHDLGVPWRRDAPGRIGRRTYREQADGGAFGRTGLCPNVHHRCRRGSFAPGDAARGGWQWIAMGGPQPSVRSTKSPIGPRVAARVCGPCGSAGVPASGVSPNGVGFLAVRHAASGRRLAEGV